MNTIVTSKEEILKTSREMIRQQGWSAISIRSVATACGVSHSKEVRPLEDYQVIGHR